MSVFSVGAVLCLGVSSASGQQTADQLYQKAHDDYVNADFEDACDLLRQLANISPNYPDSEALRNDSCNTAKSQHEAEEKLYQKALDLYNQGKYDDAKSWFERARGIPLKKPAHRDDISRYLEEIKKKQPGPTTPQVVKSNPQNPPKAPPKVKELPATDTSEQTKMLQDGLRAYFAGDFDLAAQKLSEYLKNGHKQALAYFFLGASHSTLYYLSGEKDSHQRDLAVENFHSIKDSNFQPPKQYVPKKILDLYLENVGPGN